MKLKFVENQYATNDALVVKKHEQSLNEQNLKIKFC
jgi:hypothetical protein